jgi:hypothetical protein
MPDPSSDPGPWIVDDHEGDPEGNLICGKLSNDVFWMRDPENGAMSYWIHFGESYETKLVPGDPRHPKKNPYDSDSYVEISLERMPAREE